MRLPSWPDWSSPAWKAYFRSDTFFPSASLIPMMSDSLAVSRLIRQPLKPKPQSVLQ